MRLREGIELIGSLGYAPTHFSDTRSTAQRDLDGDGDVSGNQIPNSPEWTGYLGMSAEGELRSGIDWFAQGGFRYESSRFVAEHNLATVEDLEDLGLEVGVVVDQWTVSLSGKRLNQDNALESVNRFIDASSSFRRAFLLNLPERRRIVLTIRRDI